MLATYLIWSFVLLAILSAVYDYYEKKKWNNLTSKIPGPKSYPLIGAPCALEALYDTASLLERIRNNYGGIVKLWIFQKPVIVITDPKYLQIVLNHPNCLEKGEVYDLTKEFIGDGLIRSSVPIWKKHRKIISPGFNTRNLNSFIDTFNKHSQRLVKNLEAELGTNKMFNFEKYVVTPMFNIICEASFGVEGENSNSAEKYCSNVFRILEIGGERMFKIWLQFSSIFKYSSVGREFFRLLKPWVTYTHNKIKQCQEAVSNEINFDGKIYRSFLEQIVSTGGDLSLKDITDEMNVLVVAGSDTTISAAGYAFVCLGMYQDIQEKVMDEIYSVFGNTSRPATHKDLSKLTYLECVIKETLRIYPPVFQIPRRVTADIDLGDQILPAGSSLMLGILASQRDPEIWPNPMKFDPGRFTQEEIAKRPPCSFMAFSGGSRNCIGIQFAIMELKIILSTILRSYKIDTTIKPKDIRLEFGLVTKIAGGFNISISRRDD